MANEYINSSKIQVFPVAAGRANDPLGRVFTENKIANLTRQLMSENISGFIISCTQAGSSDNVFDISFNLYGYYFTLKDFDANNYTGDIYAHLLVKDDEILGTDEQTGLDYIYKGLTISTSKDGPEVTDSTITKKSLKLFTYNIYTNSWTCSTDTFGVVSSLSIGGIDGKHS